MGENHVKVAIVQHAPVFLNLERSLELACELITEAASGGAQVVAFGETWLPGYPAWLDCAPGASLWDYPPAKEAYRLLVENSLTLAGPELARLRDAASKSQVWVVMGANERRGGSLYNTLLYIHPNGLDFRVHRKLVPTYTERLAWGRGDGSTLSVVDTEFGVLGGLICWEHWMPLARAAMHAKGEVIHVAQWPGVRELHQIASRHYAFEGQCFVLAAGCMLRRGQLIAGFRSLGLSKSEAVTLFESIPGADEVLLMGGGSAVIAPDSSYVVAPVFEKECIVYANLDLSKVTTGHLVIDTAGHYSRPDVFHLEVNDWPQDGVSFASDDV